MTSTSNQPLTTEHTQPAGPIHNLQLVPFGAISPNPNNPRNHFDGTGLKELAAYVPRHSETPAHCPSDTFPFRKVTLRPL